MACHHLKIWPQYFDAVLSGVKPFEIRENDRDYQVGDHLRLLEWSPEQEEFTGRQLEVLVTYMTEFGQKAGTVVMGIKGPIHKGLKP